MFTALASLNASVIYDTYGGNYSGPTSNIHTGNGKGVAFTMPNPLQPAPGTTSYTLDSIQLHLSGTSAGNSDITLSLYTNDGSNTPGTLIGGFTASSSFTLTPTTGVYTFNPSTSITLSASTTYWVTLQSSVVGGSGPLVYWHTSTPQPPASPSTVGVTNFGAVFGSGSPDTWTSTSSNFNAMTVNATAVPEPGAVMLIAIGATFTLLRRRNLS